MLAGRQRVLDFWPLGAGNSLRYAIRALLDLVLLFLLLPLVGLLIAAVIALWAQTQHLCHPGQTYEMRVLSTSWRTR